ncbi:bifunctional DNA primase/polymerase, partial [bacterium]|nr:bifunctional DNA primase/polymerase [bacterium]
SPMPAVCPFAPRDDCTRSDYLQAAYHYCDLGWSVFPLNRKEPVGRWKPFQEQRPRDREIGRMFWRPSWVDGVAAVTGDASVGLCVRDFDTVDGYLAWAEPRADLARRLPTVRTGRGLHVYIRLPKGYGPVYRSWKSGVLKGEVLGTPKRYVVLPPSRHPSGASYRWVWGEPFNFNDLPRHTPEELGWLEDQEQPKRTSERPPQTAPESNTVICSRGAVQNVPLEVIERDAVMKCLPTGPNQRNDCLWELARTLKALPHLADAGEADLWPFVEQWFGLAQAVIGTKSLEVCWEDFRRQWKLVQVPAGQGFDAAVSRVLTEPFPAEADQYDEEAMRRLVAVCAGLQRYAGDAPFYLSCRTAHRVCGFGSKDTANRRLNQLVEDKLLVVSWKGLGGTDRRRATRYRWVGSLAVSCSVTALAQC